MRYTEKQKLAAVRDYLSGTLGHREVARRHGVGADSLRYWAAAFREQGLAGIVARKGRERYTEELKLAVLARVDLEGLSNRKAAALFDIRRPNLIGEWKRQYDERGSAAPAVQTRTPSVMPASNKPLPKKKVTKSSVREVELLEEIQRLKMENAYLKKLEALAQQKLRSAPKKRC